MLTEVPDPAKPNWRLRALGTVLLGGLVGLAFLLTGGSGFTDNTQSHDSVDISKTYLDDGHIVELHLTGKPANVSSVYIETPLGTRTEMATVGDSKQFVAVNNTTLTVSVSGTDESVQEISIDRGYTQTHTVVAQDGSGDYTRIQPAIDAAESGDVILVQQGTYRGQVVLDKPVTLVGEIGTVIVPDDCDAAGVQQDHPEAMSKYIQTETRCR